MSAPVVTAAKEPVVAETSTTNQVTGDMKDSLQAGFVNTVNFLQPTKEVELFARQVNEQELNDVRKQFLTPENFERAERILATSNVVILMGVGAGRTFAAMRLLDGQACSRIVHLSPERQLRTVDNDDLRRGDGYLWDLSDRGARPFRGWDLDRVRRLVANTGDCWLVIILNGRDQAPVDADGLVVELRPPDAMALAAATIDRQWPDDDGAAQQVLTEGFTELLPVGEAPYKALLAADLAIRVTRDELTIAQAQQQFAGGFDREVTTLMGDSWQTVEFTLMFTIAMLQNEPFDEVVDEARNLDDLVRRSELTPGKKLRPRRTFVKPNDELIHKLQARTDLRDNPLHKGLKVETVQFTRSGWAEAVLCRIWQHYHVDHGLLMEWMCSPRMAARHFGASVWALCTLITHVFAGDRLRELNQLVLKGGPRNWRLAAATLARLEDEHGFRDLVEQALTEWVDGDIAYQKCAATVFYGYRFDQADPDPALAKIAEIARETMPSVRNTAVGTVLGIMKSSGQLDIVLRAVAAWANDAKSIRDKDGLHGVALRIGLYVLHLTEESRKIELSVDPAGIAAQYPDICRQLAKQVFDDGHLALDPINDLYQLTDWHPFIAEDKSSREMISELLRITRLLSPDLRWRHRRRVVAALCQRHPGQRRQIVRVFQVARKAERSGLCD